MIPVIIISVLSIISMIFLILKFPSLKIKGFQTDTFYIPVLIGALILLIFPLFNKDELFHIITSNSSLNPLKILVLFICVSLMSIALDEAGFFNYIAYKFINKFKASQIKLFISLYVLVSILTVFTSNDIVILTFTPFICFFCKHAKIKALPYLIAEFTAANTWSMMFIIGNPTNIYLGTAAGITFISYIKVMIVPTILAGLTELTIIFLLFRKDLNKPLGDEEKEIVHIDSKVDLIVGAAHLLICLVFLIISPYIHIEMWLVALICAGSLLLSSLTIRLIRRKEWIYLEDCFKRLPYQLIPFILSMSIIVISLNYQGVANKIGEFLNRGNLIFNYGTSSYALSNVINNIPMSILYSNVPTALTNGQYLKATYASIVGSNIGAFLTPIGALAGIMFSNLLSKYDMKFTFLDFIKYGSIVSVPVLAVALLSLGLFI